MARYLTYTIALFSSLALSGACSSDTDNDSPQAADAQGPADAGFESEVTVLEILDVSGFNEELADDKATADMAFYLTEDGPLAWRELRTNITRAQRIFAEAGVQLRVSSAMRISVPSSWQILDADDVTLPLTPEFLETDLYAHLDELQMRLTVKNQAIFEAIVSYFPDSPFGVPAANTIHFISLDEAPIPFYEWTGSEWQYDTAPTGGLSFPPYAYADRIPLALRGVITLSFEQSVISPQSRIVAHEVGHKLINVSHEGVGVCPAFAVNGTELMLYGSGEIIPEGPEGRYHRERLLLSPFVYTLNEGVAEFDTVYESGGIYADPIYEAMIVSPVCPDANP